MSRSFRSGPGALVLSALVVLLPALVLGAEEGEHAEKGAAQFVPQAVWAIISFVIVLVILLKKLLPPIVSAMDKRAADIRDALGAAEKARAETQELISRHEAQLEEARKEAAAIIEEGRADALRVQESIKTSARKEADEILARARREIEQAKLSAMDDLHRRSVELSIALAGKLIRKNLRAEEHQDLIQEQISALRQ